MTLPHKQEKGEALNYISLHDREQRGDDQK